MSKVTTVERKVLSPQTDNIALSLKEMNAGITSTQNGKPVKSNRSIKSNDKLKEVCNNEAPFIRKLTHSAISSTLMRMFNPLRIKQTLMTDFYSEGEANGYDFVAFQVGRDVMVFVKNNPVIWTLVVARDFWHEEPIDQSFTKGSTPLSCFYECDSILRSLDCACRMDEGLHETLEHFILELFQQPNFSFNS
jgi:hypothetical protein